MVDCGVQGCEQLHAGPGVADGHHRLAHALLLVGLLVHQPHAVRVAVERDRGVEVGHGDAHVVDGGEEGTWLLAHARHPRQYGGPA